MLFHDLRREMTNLFIALCYRHLRLEERVVKSR